ncbi:hypothetical protein LJR027_002262 [Terrabacter sp. LjRoot27]|uniref:hypothetical protein n=1 Tax=Terrabacter sp. LjRoot27 TaxID=3342306 RepID=UPI003ECC53FB
MTVDAQYRRALSDPNLTERIRQGAYSVQVARRLLNAEDIHQALAGVDHPDLRPRDLDEIATSSDALRRYVAASSTRAGALTLARLAEDPDPRVREAVSGNTSTPPDALRKLYDDPSMRPALLANHALPQQLISDVSCDELSAAAIIGFLAWRATGSSGIPGDHVFARINESERPAPSAGESVGQYATRAGFPPR